MPQIIPIRDLKNTSFISEKCKQSSEPIFITKNGYGDMVIMSLETYETDCYSAYVRRKLAEAENSGSEAKDAFVALEDIRRKYDL